MTPFSNIRGEPPSLRGVARSTFWVDWRIPSLDSAGLGSPGPATFSGEVE